MERILAVAVLIIASIGNAQAALVSTTLSDVTILNKIYDITFYADSGGYNSKQSYDALGGTDLTTFTSLDDAKKATEAIAAALVLQPTVLNPGWWPAYNANLDAYRLAYDTSSTLYSMVIGGYTGLKAAGHFSLINQRRDISSAYSLAVATEVGAVPIPAAVWLFGSGLLGLIGFSKRKKAA